MTRFRIGLVQTVVEEATVFVEADSFEEAEQRAIAQANAGEVEWRFLDVTEPVEVVSVYIVAKEVK